MGPFAQSSIAGLCNSYFPFADLAPKTKTTRFAFIYYFPMPPSLNDTSSTLNVKPSSSGEFPPNKVCLYNVHSLTPLQDRLLNQLFFQNKSISKFQANSMADPTIGYFDESLSFSSLLDDTTKKQKRLEARQFMGNTAQDPLSPAKRRKIAAKADISFHFDSSNFDCSHIVYPVFDQLNHSQRLDQWKQKLDSIPNKEFGDQFAPSSEAIWYQNFDHTENVLPNERFSSQEYYRLLNQHRQQYPDIQPLPLDDLLEQQSFVIKIPRTSLPLEILHNLKRTRNQPLMDSSILVESSVNDFYRPCSSSGTLPRNDSVFDDVPSTVISRPLASVSIPAYPFAEIIGIENELLNESVGHSVRNMCTPVVFQGFTQFIAKCFSTVKGSTIDDGFDEPPSDLISSARNVSSKFISCSVADESKRSWATAVAPLPKPVIESFPPVPIASLTVKQASKRFKRVWSHIMRKDVAKEFRRHQFRLSSSLAHYTRIGQIVCREVKKKGLRTIRAMRDFPHRNRRVVREVQSYWRRTEKDSAERQKNAEKNLIDQQKKEEEKRDAERQKKKLEFLLTQTELFSHFIGKKMGISGDSAVEPSTVCRDDAIRAEAEEAARGLLKQQRQESLEIEQTYKRLAGKDGVESSMESDDQDLDNVDLLNPSTMPEQALIPEPSLFNGKLKSYQLKGLNWLVNLYDQGINGILADEMGLGKTIQSISLLSYLADTHNIWGPFLIIAPNSTLIQWISEINRFCPSFKVIPYWGDIKSRKILRKFWNPKDMYKKESGFHCCVTSYATFVGDEKYFSKIHWQYVILDEAQQIKNAASMRWKSLLNIKCRNRLLLTGTPIQNSMAELWALLHFIMPSIFDSHVEFNEWFSKDIESHASGNKGKLDAHQVQRLHVILKPFMLRRVKSDVENEMPAKIEIQVNCELSRRQKKMYHSLRDKVDMSNIVLSDSNDTESLMNLVMQFRKVCNHPEIFERRFAVSPFIFGNINSFKSSKVEKARRDDFVGHFISSSLENPIAYHCPVLIHGVISEPVDLIKSQRNLLDNVLNIWHPLDIHTSSSNPGTGRSFLSLCGSPSDISLAFWSNNNCALTSISLLQHHQSKLVNGLPISLCQMTEVKTTRFSKPIMDRITDMSYFLRQAHVYIPRTVAPPVSMCINRNQQMVMYNLALEGGCDRNLFYGSEKSLLSASNSCISTSHLPIGVSNALVISSLKAIEYPIFETLLSENRLATNSAQTQVPDFSRLLADSGKLMALHELLVKLKAGGHRVLIFSQMVRMIDILEEYMHFCGHKMFRLDGSTDVFTRREMVNEFQENDDIFAFLLSTRAGGLGITLTAADTVIFYDIDWNPTMDSQAMDRVHRIGQTKQVVVYRLVCKGTIEEKILERAQEKHRIQKTVYSGGFKLQKVARESDVLKKSELKDMLLS